MEIIRYMEHNQLKVKVKCIKKNKNIILIMKKINNKIQINKLNIKERINNKIFKIPICYKINNKMIDMYQNLINLITFKMKLLIVIIS